MSGDTPGLGQHSSRTPQTPASTSHCPLTFNSFPVIASSASFLSSLDHGRHRNASPPINNMPLPLMRIWLFSANPSPVHASMLVAGATVFRRTSRAEKSVCVSSFDLGPRSRDFGGCDLRRAGRVVCRHRAGVKVCGLALRCIIEREMVRVH
jgi:hypothetical protein